MSFPCGNHQNSRISSTHFPSTPLLRRPGNDHGQHMVVIDVPAIMPCAAIPVKMVPGAIDFLPAGGRAAFVLPQTLPLSIFRPHVIPCPRQADIPPAADMAIAAVRAAMNFAFIFICSPPFLYFQEPCSPTYRATSQGHQATFSANGNKPDSIQPQLKGNRIRKKNLLL